MGDTKKYISKEELRTHNKRDDLWISINGKIYNVSDWSNHHPGGELPLLYFGGQDVTDVFLSYHPKSSWNYHDKFFEGFYLKDYNVSEISKDYRKLFVDFQNMGLFENKGHGAFILITITLMMFFVSVYGVLSSNNFWVHLACGGLLGFSWIQLGWIGHDTSHYQVMMSPRLNNLACYVYMCFNGISFVWWKRDHSSHHIACNYLEFDPNTQLLPISAPSSKIFTSLTSYYYEKKMNFDALSKFLISYQHWTFFPSFALLRVYLYALTFWTLFSKKKVTNRVCEFGALLVFWIWYSLLILSLPNWFERIAFITAAYCVTGIQGVQFNLNHVPCDTYIGPPIGDNWLEKQIIGSLNIVCSPWMDWFHGGLQFQIEHHLFPRMPKCQLRNISPFVQEFCKKHSLPYNSASFSEALMLTLNTFRDVALQARSFHQSDS